VLTLSKKDESVIAAIDTGGKTIEEFLCKEWLLTNNRSGYACSTIGGCNTRRYHGLLIGSLNPPVNRIASLANCMEMVISTQKVYNLSTFEFADKFTPEGYTYIKQFRQDTGVHFDYQLDDIELTKSLYLLRDSDSIAMVYDFTHITDAVEFTWRPFVNLRDFHSLQKSYASLSSAEIGGGLLIRHDIPNSCELFLSSSPGKFQKDEQWWFNFVYRIDRQRGQDFTEDLWTPGFFKNRIEQPCRIIFWANFGQHSRLNEFPNQDIEAVVKDLRQHQQQIIHKSKSIKHFIQNGKDYTSLSLAADKFVINRDSTTKQSELKQSQTALKSRTTILAGFPWFADWGRDAFISLPGLLLSTGRSDEAKSVLTTFANAAEKGMIPNRFDDRSNTACFNSIDASLWFINAAFQYLNVTNDYDTFTNELLGTIRRIVDSYHRGTLFNIHADKDGLITGGDNTTQLTWMDAKYNGVAFTPRCGKAVEINALWYNSLCLLARFYSERDTDSANYYHSMTDKVEESFRRVFWNETTGYLNDCIFTDGTIDASLRPNQIFAVSLPFSPLTVEQQKSVVEIVQKELLTDYGLRTLNPSDSRYRGHYTGSFEQRDGAYHQGTVWPYLIGAFVESYLKVNNFSKTSKAKAAEFIAPLLGHLTADGCLGQISEIFDGDPPHTPRGCFAQAWSVAELLRAYLMINT